MLNHKTMYTVYSSLKEDINSPTVWLMESGLDSRDLIFMKSKKKRKRVWVDAQIVDDNFFRNYNERKTTKKLIKNQRVIIANEWYRQRLGIKKGENVDLDIKQIKFSFMRPFRQMQAALHHPDNAMRISADIAIVSLFLGVLGLILGIISLMK